MVQSLQIPKQYQRISISGHKSARACHMRLMDWLLRLIKETFMKKQVSSEKIHEQLLLISFQPSNQRQLLKIFLYLLDELGPQLPLQS